MGERNVLGFERYFVEVVLVEEANKPKRDRENRESRE